MLLNKLLEKLAKYCNKPDVLVNKQLFKLTKSRYDFYFVLPITKRLELHKALELLSMQTQAFDITYAPKGFGEENIIESIDITDCRKILAYLNIPINADETTGALFVIENIKHKLPPWLHQVLGEIKKGWLKGLKPYHCSVNNINALVDGCHFLSWIEEYDITVISSLDMRTVSVKLFKDSKRLESIASTIKNLMKYRLPEELINPKGEEVLSYLGVSRFPPLFRVKGGISIISRFGIIEANKVWPYVAIPPDGIIDINVIAEPKYVLFIENQTTYERYTREIDDDGLIFYTNGFPSKTWQKLYRNLQNKLHNSIKFYHWGDIDIGGYNILRFMQSLFDCDLHPHNMDPLALTAQDGIKRIEVKALIRALIDINNKPIALLKEKLTQSNLETINWVEQESIEIHSLSSNYGK